MSHFSVLAIVRSEDVADEGIISRACVESSIEDLLEPYSEAIEVDEYDEPCWCVNSKAQTEAREQTEAVFGTFQNIRDNFNNRENIINLRRELSKLYDVDGLPDKEKIDEINALIQKEWDRTTKPFVDFEKTAFDNHPDKDKADPDCEDCKGTGIQQSTYNPKSKWDWYEIGGRWTGLFSAEYDPAKDPLNIETCFICGGTGTRHEWPEGTTQEWINQCNGCNGCHGTGKRVKWSLRDFEGDILPMPQVIASLTAQNEHTYAVLTPDGEWGERGEMGWFGMASNEMSEEEWKIMFFNVLEKYNSDKYIGVVVDCHI